MENIENIKKRYRQINYTWNKLTSEELVDKMKNKDVWDHYQYLRTTINEYKKTQKPQKNKNRGQRKDSRLTYEVINDDLGDFGGIIADFGCAQNELAKLRKNNKVYGLDFYAKDGSGVIECSLTKVPLPNEKVDAVIISLALSTSDYHKVLEEAHRVLKPGGLLKLVIFVVNSAKSSDIIKKHFPNIGFSFDKTKIIGELIYIDAYKNEI